MKKLNLFGKIAALTVVLVVVAGFYLGSGMLSKSGASNTITGFAAAIENKNYTDAFGLLSSGVQSAGSKAAFAERMASRFGNTSLKLEKLITKGSTGFAILFLEGKSDYITLPLIKESGEWKINHFANEARCVDKCTAGIYCKDGKTLIDCKDADGDGCTDETAKTCEFSCSDNKCSLVQEDYTLSIGQSVFTLSKKIRLDDVDPNKGEATIEIGDDPNIFAKGETKIVKGVSVTLISVGKESVTLKAKEV